MIRISPWKLPARKLALLMNTSQIFGTLCIAHPGKRYAWRREADRAGGADQDQQGRPICLVRRQCARLDELGRDVGRKNVQCAFAWEHHERDTSGLRPKNRRTVKQSRGESARLRVLVIDPDPKTVEAVRACLPPEASIQTAGCGTDALRLTLEFDPQIILTEWEVPGLSGVGALPIASPDKDRAADLYSGFNANV